MNKAYIAGFFDGEGSVNIIKQKARGESQEGKFTHFLVCSVANTNREVLDAIQSVYGSNVAPVRGKGNAKSSYRLHFTRRQAEIFLTDIYPFLLLKKQQVALGLKSRETIRKGSYCGRSKVLSNQALHDRDKLENEIKKMNKSQISKLTWDIPDEAKAQYMAGLFDAEGSMSILKPSAKVHRLYVSVSSVDKGIIEWISINAEGIGTITKRTQEYEKWNDSWKWQVSDDRALGFLKVIEPYLIIKKRQVEIATEFRNTVLPAQGLNFGSRRGSGDVKNPLTDELVLYRDELQNQMNALNKRGI
jgi:intein/homing endonuclease